MTFAAALSEHPLAAHATGEVVGQILEALPDPPDLALLTVSGGHRDQFEQIAETVRRTLAPRSLLGATASGVLAGDREVEDQPAVALWGGSTGPTTPMRLDALRRGAGVELIGVPDLDPDRAGVLIVLAAPSFPIGAAVNELAVHHGHLTVVGGVAPADPRSGDSRLLLGDQIITDGAVAVLVEPAVPVTTVVSQGYRPIGSPLVVTRSSDHTIAELAGRPVLDRLDELLLALDDGDRDLVRRGLHLGRVVDEHRLSFGAGDFLVRPVVRVDREVRSIVVADPAPVGTTVQFQVRDAASADDELRTLLTGHRADGALIFTGHGRGVRLFGDPDHDAATVSAFVSGRASAGLFCAGEIGPVGTNTFVHRSTAVVVLLADH